MLVFPGKLRNFRVRNRHTTKPYTTPVKGPMLEHMLVCDVVGDAIKVDMAKA